jgi:O-antigen ligase
MVIPLVVSGAINAITHTYVVAAEEGYTRIRLLWGGSAILFAWAILVELVRPHVTRSRTAILLAVTGVIGILMANHRSAFIALLVVLPLLFRPRNKVARRLLVVLLLGLGAALVMLALVSLTPGDAFGYSAARLLDFTTGNGADRLMRWRLAAATFWATPFNDITWTDQWYLVDLARNYGPHNWILEVLVSEGVLGFAFYLGVFAQTLRYSRRWARQDGVVTGLSTFVAFFIVFCSFNANFYAMANQSLLWLAIALLSHRAEQLQQDAVIAAYSLEASGN